MIVLLLSVVSLAQQGAAVAPPAQTAALTPAEKEAAARLREATIREVTTALSAKEMEGRGTAQPGGLKAAQYIAGWFNKLGLKPLGDGGGYLQSIRFKSSQVLGDTSFKAETAGLGYGEEFIVAPPSAGESSEASGDLVFVGYGVVSPELKRDDFAGLELKGKIAVVLKGKPKNVDEAVWGKASSQQELFKNLLIRGAAGVIVTNLGTPEQPFSLIANYLTRRQVQLADRPGFPFKLPPILIVSDEGAEKLFAGSGTTFAGLMAQAANGEMVSRDLHRMGTIAIKVKSEEGTSNNVAGVLEGSDPALKAQAIVYTAHYDAFGLSADGRIFPGAADNALGVGELISIAEAMSRAAERPKRSVIFLSVTGEEYGLLGAEYWVAHPTWPVEKVAADLNFDGIGTEIYGPVKRVVGFGMEYSDLGSVLKDVARAENETIVPDPFPEEKAFYRSDHYAFVKKGVPALMLLGGPEGELSVWLARAKKWLATDYHQPTDTVRPDWNWDGPRTLASMGLLMGMRVANASAMPAWLPGAPFSRTASAAAHP